jgi:hypothetical protein
MAVAVSRSPFTVEDGFMIVAFIGVHLVLLYAV